VLASLEDTPFADWMRGDSLMGWPLVLTVHVLGTAVAIGLIFIVGLRLLGLFESISYVALRRLFPAIWIALAVQLISGFALWMAKPTRYVADVGFMLKFLLVVIGAVLTVYLYALTGREVAFAEKPGEASSRSSVVVAASLLVWCGVVIASRMTAHLGALYSG
jgi:hypothetical protein